MHETKKTILVYQYTPLSRIGVSHANKRSVYIRIHGCLQVINKLLTEFAYKYYKTYRNCAKKRQKSVTSGV